ncbi:MAG: PAS domain S-box protein [Planctomycetaceae bacterium]|nr:PAS domain S-box protein [Planctomycetaceae bacterium]
MSIAAELLPAVVLERTFVDVSMLLLSTELPAALKEALLPSLLAAIVGLLVFSTLYASKIVAGRRHVEELQRALRDKEKAVLALEASEERFRTLCDHAPVGIFVDDGRGNGVYHNSKCGEITGLSVEGGLGNGWHTAIHPDDRERVVNRVLEAVSKGEAYQDCNRYVHSDGTVRWVEGIAVPVKAADGELVAYVGTLLDVTAQRKAAEAQQASESRYLAIVNEQSDLIVRWQTNGTLLFANQAWCDFQGCSLDEALGIDFLSVVPDQRREELRQWASTVTAEQPVVSGESTFVMADGRRHFQLWTEHGIFDEQGRLIEIQSVGRDITAEREAEDQFREQQSLLAHVSRLSTMGELVAGIAHEVNQPLYSIKNCAQALQNVLADENQSNRELMVQCADQISDASSRAGEMIRRMRSFVRHGETEREVCDLNLLVEEAVRLVEFEGRRHQATVVVRPTNECVLVRVDRVQIQQVLVNLLKNAFESIAAAGCEIREVEACCSVAGSVGKISIVDSGPGVPEEFIETIFDAFVTTRKEGMGMGLAISRTIVEGHYGRIRVEQPQGSGAAFLVELPLHDPAQSFASIDVTSAVDPVSDVTVNAVNVVAQEA